MMHQLPRGSGTPDLSFLVRVNTTSAIQLLPSSEIPSSSEDCTSSLIHLAAGLWPKAIKTSLTDETDAPWEGETFVHLDLEEKLGSRRREQSVVASGWGPVIG